jgi:hypothetical protein
MEFSMLTALGWGPLWVILILMFVARPLAVWLAAIKTDLSWQEKIFLGWIAPRGIVAAAVSALFAFKLEKAGYSDANALVSMVFLVIMVTVIVQSISSKRLAKVLDVREANNNGYLFIGANAVARELAKALVARNIRVILADTSWINVRAARMDNLPVYYGNPVSEHAENNLDTTGIGHVLVVSPYKQLNTLSTYHYLDLFGEGRVLGLPEGDQAVRASHQSSEKYAQTRNHFDETATFAKLASLISKGAMIKTTQLSSEFSFEDYLQKHGNRLTLLFAIKPDKQLVPLSQKDRHLPQEGWDIVSLIQPAQQQAESAENSGTPVSASEEA